MIVRWLGIVVSALLRVSLREGRYGRVLVCRGGWSFVKTWYIKHNLIDGVCLNYALGWRGGSLDFLRKLRNLKDFTILDWRIQDIRAIHSLSNARRLQIYTYCNTPIDFGSFPHLEDCGFEWRPKSESLFCCKSLKRLFLNRYHADDLKSFASMKSLESLKLANCTPKTLGGLENLRSLKELGIYNANKITSLNELGRLRNLKRLEIRGCRGISNINAIAVLKELRFLEVSDCGAIESLRPVEDLKNLRELYFIESTSILDGDLSFLQKMPALEVAWFQNRKHYSHTREAIGLEPK